MSKGFVVFDLEATCVNYKAENFVSEIIEIGAVKLDKDLNIIEQRAWFVKPILSNKLSDFCIKLTGIENEMVFNKKVKTFKDVIEEFEEWVDNDLMISWGGYDKRQLLLDSKLHKKESTDWIVHHLNLKNAFHEEVVLKDFERSGQRVPNKFKKPLGLARALNYLSLELVGNHHRALDDAINTVRVLIESKNKLLTVIQEKQKTTSL